MAVLATVILSSFLFEDNNFVISGLLQFTIREICKMVGVASTSSVYAHLKILEEKGYIARKMDASRAIAIL